MSVTRGSAPTCPAGSHSINECGAPRDGETVSQFVNRVTSEKTKEVLDEIERMAQPKSIEELAAHVFTPKPLEDQIADFMQALSRGEAVTGPHSHLVGSPCIVKCKSAAECHFPPGSITDIEPRWNVPPKVETKTEYIHVHHRCKCPICWFVRLFAGSK